MTDYLNEIIGEIEIHSVEGIKSCFEKGLDPNVYYNGLPLIYELTSEYLRSARFKECVKAFINYGLIFGDKLLLSVLSDDAELLEECLVGDPGSINKRYTLRCAFTPLQEATLLHICAEFNHISCARVLAKYGAVINARAGLDEHGFGGQTSLFHTVNQHGNHSVEMLNFLLSNGADPEITVRGFVWGKGYEWETFIPSVNSISYAMMGLLPQMHRDAMDVAGNISLLLKSAYGIHYTLPNVPNKYLVG